MKKLRIALAMQGGTAWIGGTEYIKNLILSCGHLPAEERAEFELCLVSSQPLDAGLAALLEPHLASHRVLSKDLPATTIPNRARWLIDRRLRGRPNSRFAEFVATQRFDFLYPLTYDNQYNIEVAFPIGDAFGACRWAGWIPDFQHRFMPQLFHGKEIAKRDAGIAALVGEAKTIVFSSENAAGDYRRFYPQAKAAPPVLHFYTLPNAAWLAGDPLAVQRQFHLPDRFFMASNQFWQHKNHGILFDALAILRERGLRPEIVCTGHPYDFRDKEYFNSLLRQMHERGVAAQVHVLGLIARAEQMQLMRRCLAVVQPSLFEGWSTVVEDARALGKRIVMSDIDVHREQNPEGGAYYARDSAEGLAAILAQWWEQLSPGPDPDGEARAIEEGTGAALNYARQFLQIARTAP
jgi:glycosyltransferase involved in cell wall biosynthesis